MLNYIYVCVCVCVCAHIEIKINSYKIIINVNLQSSAEQVAVCVSRVCVCVRMVRGFLSVSQSACSTSAWVLVCVHACIYVYMLYIFICSANWTFLQCINQCNFAIALAGGTHRAQQTDTHTQTTETTHSTLWENWKLFSFCIFLRHIHSSFWIRFGVHLAPNSKFRRALISFYFLSNFRSYVRAHTHWII